MKRLNNDVLNKYVDNELDEFEINELKEIINSNPEAQKQLNAHEMVDIILRKLEAKKAPAGINQFVMDKILNIPQSKSKVNYFFVSVIVVFTTLIFSSLGYLLSQVNFGESSSSTSLGVKEKIANFVSDYIPQVPALLDTSTLLFIGGSLTVVLLISGYFIIENHRSFKSKLNSFTH